MKNHVIRFDLIVLVSFLVLFQSCNQKKQEDSGYQINAEISGIDDGIVKLVKLDLTTNEPVNVDSTKIKNGYFNFTGKVKSAYLHTLVLPNSSDKIHLFLDNSKINIKGSIKNLDQIKVTGSREDSLFRSYSLDDIFDRKKGKEIMLQYPKYNYTAMVAYYQFQYFNIPVDRMQSIINSFGDGVKKSDYFEHLNKLFLPLKRVAINQPAPHFNIKNTKGEDIRLTDFKGKYVLIDFWASWCAPCRESNPKLVKAYQTYHNRNFTILGISVDKDRKRWVKAIEKDNLPWVNVSNLKGWGKITDLYGVKAVPQNFLINPDGIIISKNIEIDELMKKLDTILKP